MIEVKASGRGVKKINLGLIAVRQAVPVLVEQIAREAESRVAHAFRTGRAPDNGAGWAELKVRSGRPLRDSGILASSVNARTSGNTITIGAGHWYGVVHQNGMVIHAKEKKVLYSSKLKIFFGKSVTIPARPFLPTGDLPRSWRARFNLVAIDTLNEIFQGGDP